jgi:hypothetical protein
MTSETSSDPLLVRMHAWAVSHSLNPSWHVTTDQRQDLWIPVPYADTTATAVITASARLVTSTVYRIDELPDNELLPLALGLVCRVNQHFGLARFSADVESREIRACVLIPRLSGTEETEMFEALVGGIVNGIEVWLDASEQLRDSLDRADSSASQQTEI